MNRQQRRPSKSPNRQIQDMMAEVGRTVRRPLDLWSGPLVDYDGITEVMAQNHVWDIVDMDALDEVGNFEGLDRIFSIN